jgi:predicted RNase H-like HicB family nuclease
MKYPVAITQQIGEKSVTVSVPDLPGCQEVAETIDIAMVRINEAIASHLTILAEYGESIPHPQMIDHHIEQSHDRSIVWAIIDIDISPYLGRSHKINVTLPELLIKQIDEQVSKEPSYKTRSGFIATACLAQLHKQANNP